VSNVSGSTSIATGQFHEAYATLRAATRTLRRAARDAPGMSSSQRRAARDSVLSSLSTVETHMRLDEQVMYPAVAERLRDRLATASMRYDHLAIRDWLRRLRAADPNQPELLQELLYGLDALIRVHLWKEEALYLRMLESPSWPAS
jgi:iron-sulfur cluster repair protein YtfE (RIC family)